jgi:5-methylcytosine-specific restriction protein B
VHKHWRPVEWIRTGVPRNELSYAAKEEISSATTLFQIATGEDEIGHLLTTPLPDTKPDYSWSDFYPRLADALLEFRGDRTALLDKMWAASTVSRRPQLFKYLRGDHRVDGSRGPVRDIDPFTVFGSFNRGIRNDARALIAAASSVWSQHSTRARVSVRANCPSRSTGSAPGRSPPTTPRAPRS